MKKGLINGKIILLLLIVAFMYGGTCAQAQERTDGAHTIEYEPDKLKQSSTDSVIKKAKQAALPESYSAVDKGYVTPAKNQGNYGTCWAFAFASTAESYMIENKGASKDVNYSEKHLAYFLYNRQTDPLGNTAGDANIITDGGNYLSEGCNTILASFFLSGHCGLVDDETVPYGDETAPDSSLAYGYNSAVLRNALFFPDSDANGGVTGVRTAIKTAVMENGSVLCNYYSDENYYYWKNNSYSYYYGGEQTGYNHTVCIVGWDDNYSADNFGSEEGSKPAKDGAWLVKNSWGTTLDYFWLSYEDPTISDIVEVTFDPASKYDYNYQYDGTVSTEGVYLEDTGSMANIFKVKGNDSGNDERLKAVSFAVDSAETSYSIQIYTDVKDTTDPTSGTTALKKPITGKTTYSGIYTVDINEEVLLTEGSNYSIVITNKSGEDAAFFVDSSADLGFIQTESYTEAGQSFYKANSSDGWYDLNEANYAARIKGLTVDTDKEAVEQTDGSDTNGTDINGTDTNGSNTNDQKLNNSIETNETDKNDQNGDQSNNKDQTVNQNDNKNQTDNKKQTDKTDNKDQTVQQPDDKDTTSKKIETNNAVYSGIKNVAYTGKAIKPNITIKIGKTTLKKDTDYTLTYKNNKAIGTATIVIKYKGSYTGTAKKTFQIVPAQAKITTLKWNKKKATIKYKKVAGSVTGYQIQYGTNAKNVKNVSCKKLTDVIRGLKKHNKYYFRVRAYKSVNGKKYYGAYSTKKYVRT